MQTLMHNAQNIKSNSEGWKTLVSALLFFAIGAIGARAQAFQPSWISCPTSGEGQAVYFRRLFLTDKRPETAWLSVTSMGRFKIYVNGMCATDGLPLPMRERNEAKAYTLTLNVTRFLKTDSNVVALIYAPIAGDREIAAAEPQIAINYYGKDGNGQSFSHASSTDWLCKAAPLYIYKGGEYVDGRKNQYLWRELYTDIATWQSAQPTNGPVASEELRSFYQTERITKIIRPKFFDLQGDSVVYDFGDGFTGNVRLTMRNARRGEVIRVGNLEYVCSGATDEQASLMFTTQYCRKVIISGNRLFNRSHITNVEGIAIEPVWHKSYRY